MKKTGTTTRDEDEYFARLEKQKKEELREKVTAEEKQKAAAARKQAHWMKCPKCGGELATITYRGVDVDRCPDCNGIFLDDGELEALAKAPESGGFLRGFLSSIKGKK